MKQNPKICMITNIGPHYRYPIFEKISKELGCDFYLGDKVYLPIKTFNYKDLSGYKATLTNHFFGKFYWQSNSIKLLFKKYNTFFVEICQLLVPSSVSNIHYILIALYVS